MASIHYYTHSLRAFSLNTALNYTQTGIPNDKNGSYPTLTYNQEVTITPTAITSTTVTCSIKVVFWSDYDTNSGNLWSASKSS